MAFSMGVTFAYVASSAFVLQSMNGLSPVVYSVVFAGNAVGLTLATLAAAWLAGRVPTRSVIGAGLVATGSPASCSSSARCGSTRLWSWPSSGSSC